MAFTRRRWMYPVELVFTAVSIRPSRPPMAWKKNSCGQTDAMMHAQTRPAQYQQHVTVTVFTC